MNKLKMHSEDKERNPKIAEKWANKELGGRGSRETGHKSEELPPQRHTEQLQE